MHRLLFLAILLIASTLQVQSQCWSLIWQDEFNGTSLNTNDWNYFIGPAYNNELQYYTDRPENVKVENGSLKLIARQENYGGKNYTSGRIDTRYKVNFTYGKIEGRMKLMSGQGLWPAFWLLPTNGTWPQGGEMDIMELLGHAPATTYATCHYVANNVHASLGNSYTLPTGNFADGFHTFALEWAPTYLKWTVDGNIIFNVTKTQVGTANWPFNKDFYVILNFAVGGDWPGSPNSSTVFPSTMEVDYVRVYQKNLNVQIAGPTTAEPNTTKQYKLPTWAGATYNWTATGGTILSGQGTSSVQVKWTANGAQTLGCTFTNTCGTQTINFPVTVTPNHWTNFSFESGLTNWNTVSTSGSNAVFSTVSASNAPHGSKVAKIVVSALGPNTWNTQLGRSNVAVIKDTSYTFRFWGRSSVNGKKTQVNFLNPTNFTNYKWQNITLTTTYTLYQMTFIAPYTGNLLFTQDFGFNTGTYFMDNYSFGRTSIMNLNSSADDRFELVELEEEAAGIQITPNPVIDAFTVKSAPNQPFSVTDMYGKTLYSGMLDAEGRSSVRLNDAPRGMYLVNVQQQDGRPIVQKMVKN